MPIDIDDVFHHACPLIRRYPIAVFDYHRVATPIRLDCLQLHVPGMQASCSQMAACLNGPGGRGVQVWSWVPGNMDEHIRHGA